MIIQVITHRVVSVETLIFRYKWSFFVKLYFYSDLPI